MNSFFRINQQQQKTQGEPICLNWASLVAQMVKHLSAMQETWFDPWVGKVPWRRKWQLTPVFLPGKSHGQQSLVGYRL